MAKGQIGPLAGSYKTGLAIRDSDSRRPSIYQSWQGMKQRCSNPKHPKYHRYGGRGITFCKEWESIVGFSEWAFSNGWAEGLSLDRIDNDGNYCPENCRWVSVSENSRKKSTTKISEKQALEIRRRKTEDISVLAKEFGCCEGTIWWIWKNRSHVKDGECVRQIREIRQRRVK